MTSASSEIPSRLKTKLLAHPKSGREVVASEVEMKKVRLQNKLYSSLLYVNFGPVVEALQGVVWESANDFIGNLGRRTGLPYWRESF